jgi:hypothetical protein
VGARKVWVPFRADVPTPTDDEITNRTGIGAASVRERYRVPVRSGFKVEVVVGPGRVIDVRYTSAGLGQYVEKCRQGKTSKKRESPPIQEEALMLAHRDPHQTNPLGGCGAS